jgi:selenocysteine-specific elongation factor
MKAIGEAEARTYVVGTAGHVDHGKSTLVHALTGIDPDRLREEKERGLTIDLGFAHFTVPSGDEISIVDVPGHERFIKNMLAGVGGIDLALLVIAADESVMPQTREHLAIIDLLGIDRGVVALTRADLVDPDLLAIAEADAADVIASTSLAGSPIVPCSGVTGLGLPELVDAIAEQLECAERRRDIGRPRLPIDRVFTMTGFGTVVTGTLIDGSLSTGDEVEILPDGLRARIRGLQHHGRKVEIALPGTRTAVNLASVPVEKLRRGMVVALPGTLRPIKTLDARIRAVPYLDRPIRHNLRVTFHTGSSEVAGRLLLLGTDALQPGESAWAQLRLSAPVVAVPGDRFIIRDTNDTLAGGTVIAADPPRHRRFHEQTISGLERHAQGSPEDLVMMAISRLEPVEMDALTRALNFTAAAAASAVRALTADGRARALGAPPDAAVLVTETGFAALSGRIDKTLKDYHEAFPLRPGMPREELRSRLGLPQRAFEAVLAALADPGKVQDGPSVSLAGHAPRLSDTDRAVADAYVATLLSSPYAPPTEHPPPTEILAHLAREGVVVVTPDGVVFAAQPYVEMTDAVRRHLQEHGAITLAQARDMFGTTRKYAQALLEHLDSQRVTRRDGDERVLAGQAARKTT